MVLSENRFGQTGLLCRRRARNNDRLGLVRRAEERRQGAGEACGETASGGRHQRWASDLRGSLSAGQFLGLRNGAVPIWASCIVGQWRLGRRMADVGAGG